jgi:hypothetical protein
MRWLLHIYRLMTQPSGKNRLLGFGDRNWQVIYEDGKSIPMFYDVACDYAEMYNGKVVKYKKD